MTDSKDKLPQSASGDAWLEIGTIVAAQGLKGELRIRSSSDFPERFEQPGERWLQDPKGINPPRSVQLLKGRYLPGKNIYVVRLAEVEDRILAESLVNHRLLVPQNDRIPLTEDEYHVGDLVNLGVYHHTSGAKIGIVTDVMTAGNDLLEVQLDVAENPTKVLIPFVKAIVPVVDLARQRIEIQPPDGLLDLGTEEKQEA